MLAEWAKYAVLRSGVFGKKSYVSKKGTKPRKYNKRRVTMRMHKTSHRVIAMLLTLVMLLSALPMTVFAAEDETVSGETVKGESVVVDANGAIAVQREVNFNKDWKFYLGNNNAASNKNFDDSSWTDVDLPHDFSIIQHELADGVRKL